MTMTDQKLPAAKGGLCPYLTMPNATEAARFYEKAFGAETVFAYPPDDQGRTMHVHVYINGTSLMLSDPFPEHGHAFKGHEGFSLQLHVDDADTWQARATEAGCEVLMPVQDMFWGDRWGQSKDPFGVIWAFNQARG